MAALAAVSVVSLLLGLVLGQVNLATGRCERIAHASARRAPPRGQARCRDSVWGAAYRAQAHSLHVYVVRLGKKPEVDPHVQRHLLTAPGVGYRFVTEI